MARRTPLILQPVAGDSGWVVPALGPPGLVGRAVRDRLPRPVTRVPARVRAAEDCAGFQPCRCDHIERQRLADSTWMRRTPRAGRFERLVVDHELLGNKQLKLDGRMPPACRTNCEAASRHAVHGQGRLDAGLRHRARARCRGTHKRARGRLTMTEADDRLRQRPVYACADHGARPVSVDESEAVTPSRNGAPGFAPARATRPRAVQHTEQARRPARVISAVVPFHGADRHEDWLAEPRERSRACAASAEGCQRARLSDDQPPGASRACQSVPCRKFLHVRSHFELVERGPTVERSAFLRARGRLRADRSRLTLARFLLRHRRSAPKALAERVNAGQRCARRTQS